MAEKVVMLLLSLRVATAENPQNGTNVEIIYIAAAVGFATSLIIIAIAAIAMWICIFSFPEDPRVLPNGHNDDLTLLTGAPTHPRSLSEFDAAQVVLASGVSAAQLQPGVTAHLQLPGIPAHLINPAHLRLPSDVPAQLQPDVDPAQLQLSSSTQVQSGASDQMQPNSSTQVEPPWDISAQVQPANTSPQVPDAPAAKVIPVSPRLHSPAALPHMKPAATTSAAAVAGNAFKGYYELERAPAEYSQAWATPSASSTKSLSSISSRDSLLQLPSREQQNAFKLRLRKSASKSDDKDKPLLYDHEEEDD